jgi:hypothetical protein
MDASINKEKNENEKGANYEENKTRACSVLEKVGGGLHNRPQRRNMLRCRYDFRKLRGRMLTWTTSTW